jgi:hypothetical protein
VRFNLSANNANTSSGASNLRLTHVVHRAEWNFSAGIDRTNLPAAKPNQSLRQFGAAVAGCGNIAGELLQVLPCLEFFAEELGVTDDHGQKIIQVMSDTSDLQTGRLRLLAVRKHSSARVSVRSWSVPTNIDLSSCSASLSLREVFDGSLVDA